ncbi:hypothetical protein TNCV_4116361 [Trichonephila clavipes]|nr:hypothetical protein TNCV_4116361 [Trichonephila clavipes]
MPYNHHTQWPQSKIHRLLTGSNPQPWVQTRDKQTTPPSRLDGPPRIRGNHLWNLFSKPAGGRGSPVVKVSDHDRHFMCSSPVPLKTRLVEQRCTLNLSRAETSSLWCSMVVKRAGC